MSGEQGVLAPHDDDISKLLMAGTHLGSRNVDFQMKKYVYKRRSDGTHIINIHKTWEKLLFAARILVAIENPKDICAISGPQFGQRAVLKFAVHVGATPIAGRFTPGTFTNQIQRAFQEPRILIVTDPRVDHQPIQEASYVNLPTIAFCDTDSPLRHVDVVIPGSNKSVHSIGLLWWMLAREVLRMRGSILRTKEWEIMPDLYFYRDLEEAAAQEQEEAKEYDAAPAFGVGSQWDGSVDPAAAVVGDAAIAGDWNAAAPAALPASGMPAAQPVQYTQDWAATPSQEWSAAGAGGWDAAQ